ncbi:hypothetical protein [Chamaesiphon sp.]|uniref:hypothetical protein n=1 Tax=Chamaesiphon sp. TaxID=2814140 RepID=UPI003593C076
MLRHTSLTKTHWIYATKYLTAMVSIGVTLILLDAQSSAKGFNLLPARNSVAVSADRRPQILAQNSTGTINNSEVNKDLRLQDITVTRNSSDKSLLTVTGSIDNRSDRTHYVYYVVAKFISRDVSIKQAIIPVNINIEPGKSKPFTHEISTDIDSIVPETVKALVLKYEYR